MSTPRFSVQEQTPVGYKYSLAIRLLDDIIPTILSINIPFTRRVAKAYSWAIFLKNVAPTIFFRNIGENIEDDYKSWGEDELDKIAKALGEYAAELLKSIFEKTDKGIRIGVPKPPSPLDR